jgi:cyanuric acid amidohydrolase
MMNTDVHKIPMDAPDDMKGLISLIENKIIKAEEIVAIIVKTEGNGNVNDFTRGFATFRFQTLLSGYLKCSLSEVSDKVSIVCSGGCEGVMSPHSTVFVKANSTNNDYDKKKTTSNDEKHLAIGIKNTRKLLPEEIGTSIHAKEVAKGVRDAMVDASISDVKDVHFVQIKCPLLTPDRINDADKRQKKVVTRDTLKSMAYSRGASALGVAVALQEVDEKRVTDLAICNEWTLYSSVASASAGIELMNNEIIVMGNSENSSNPFVIGHGVMKDAIDSSGIRDALKNAGLYSNNETVLSEKEKQKLVNVFAKAGVHPTGIVMGRRTTMLTDSDISSTRHVRAVVNAVIASIIGDPMVYVSGGSEHQGPVGGGPVAVIAQVWNK